MNYYQPTYDLVTKNPHILTSQLSAYQAALWHALELEAISDGEYKSAPAPAMYIHDEDHAKNAVKHAADILDMLNINTLSEYHSGKDVIQKWFGATIREGKKEFVCIDQQWYVRTWHEVKLSKPKHKMITVHQNDPRSDAGGHDLKALFDNGKKIRPLEHASKMAGRTKLSSTEQQKFMKNLRGRTNDTATANKYREHSLKMRNRMQTLRSLHVNDLVHEILSHSRYVVFCVPMAYNDIEYMKRIGVPEALELLTLIEFMTRRDENGVTFIEADTRPFRCIFENEDEKPREYVAHKIAELYMHMRNAEAD